MKRAFLLPVLLFVSTIFCFSQSKIDSLYLGMTFPGKTPALFLSGISERIAISSDGKDIYFNSMSGLSYYHYTANGWGTPKALFNGYGEAALSANDSILYIQNSQPNSYYSVKNGTGWSAPVKLWNSNTANKHHLQVTNSGTFYLTSVAKISSRGDISKVIVNGTNISLQSLPKPVNSSLNGVDFYIAKDESYIIFPQISALHGTSGGDLFISFRKSDNSWSNTIELPNKINTSDWEYGPYISPDKQYLFFSRATETSASTYWVKIGNMIDSLKNIVITNSDFKEFGQDIQIYPNPSNGKITVSFGAVSKNNTMEIRDVSGKLITSGIYCNTPATTIDLTGNSKGMYFLKLTIDDRTVIKKICLE